MIPDICRTTSQVVNALVLPVSVWWLTTVTETLCYTYYTLWEELTRFADQIDIWEAAEVLHTPGVMGPFGVNYHKYIFTNFTYISYLVSGGSQ